MKCKSLSKILALGLSAAMTMCMLAGCGQAETDKPVESSTAKESETQTADTASTEQESQADEPVAVTYPLVTDVTLDIYIAGGMDLSANYTDFDDTPFIQGLEEKTGVNLEVESAAVGSDVGTAFNLLLQEDELPDIIMGSAYGVSDLKEYVEDGILRDITEYLPIYAPDYWAILNSDEEIWARNRRIGSIDGEIPYFIGGRDNTFFNAWSGLMIRKDWLDELGLEIPETIEEFDEVARAFYEYNGSVITYRPGVAENFGFVASGVGAFAGNTMKYYVEDGEVKLGNAQPEWKEYLTWFNKWYEDGILDTNFSAAVGASLRQQALDQVTGIYAGDSGNLDLFVKQAAEAGIDVEWIGIPGLVEEKGEMCHFSHAEYSSWNGYGSAFVTTDCSEEELITALQFLNYGYTEEGMLYCNFGKEGVSYELDENGKPQFTDLVMNDPRGPMEARKDYTATTATGLASLFTYDCAAVAFSEEYMQALTAWNTNTDYMSYMLPTLSYTDDEKSVRSDIRSAMSTYISEMALKFITGEEPLDNFDDFVKTLESMGLDQLLEIENAAYQRFMAE